MDSEYPFVLLGDHFYLASLLKHKREAGLIWESSTLHRKSSGLIDMQFEGNNTHAVNVSGQYISRPVKKSQVNLKNISETVGFDVVFVELGFNGFMVMTSEFVKYQDYDLTQSALAVIAKNKSRFNVYKSENINYANKYLPLIPGSILEQDFHLEIITTALKSFDKKMFSKNKCLIVLSGELIWSGWLSQISLPELVSIKFPWDNYYKTDRSGVWQYLIAGSDPERFLINKSIFDPELFCMELPTNINKKSLTFTKDGREKVIYPSGSVDFFDLKDSGWNYKSLMLPKYLLVKGIVPKNPTKQQYRTKLVTSEGEHLFLPIHIIGSGVLGWKTYGTHVIHRRNVQRVCKVGLTEMIR